MFTVILLSDYFAARLERWREVFAPFESSGAIAFCHWQRSSRGRRLGQAAPDLIDLIKGKQEWRAVVVGNGLEGAADYLQADELNPFDFDMAEGDHEEVREAEQREDGLPLIRLAHILLGYPELGIERFEASDSVILPSGIGPGRMEPGARRRVHREEFISEQLGLGKTADEARDAFELMQLLGHDPQVHFRAVKPSGEKAAEQERLSRAYRVEHTPPDEVVMIARRRAPSTRALDQVGDLWRQDEGTQGRERSQFTRRNRYPTSCRFVVYDQKAEAHSGFDLDELRFWFAVLALALNNIPPSAFQPDRLYRVDVDLDNAEFGRLLNEHLGRLTSLRDHVTVRLKEPAPLAAGEKPKVLEIEKSVGAEERLDVSALSVPLGGYGVLGGKRGDGSRWQSSVTTLEGAADRFTRQPRRVLAEMSQDTRLQQSYSSQESVRLTSTQRAEIEEDLLDRTTPLVQPPSQEGTGRRMLESIVARHDAAIKRKLLERIRASTVGIVLGVVLGVWFAVLIPYLILSAQAGLSNVLEALLILVVILGLLTMVAWVLLLIFRHRFVKALRAVNSDLRAYADDVSRQLRAAREFLGSLLTYMSRRAVLTADDERLTRRVREERRLERLRRRLEERIDSEKGIVRSLGEQVHVLRGGASHHEFAQSSIAALEREFCWPRTTARCLFNSSGESIEAPYGFITRLHLVDVKVHEPMPDSGA
jgi:hypothetical protein